MTRPGIAQAIARSAAALLLIAVAAGTTWAVADDFGQAEIVPLGTVVEGGDLSGLPLAAARDEIDRGVTQPLMRELDVRTDDDVMPLDPADFLELDVEGMLRRALEPRVSRSLAERTWARVSRGRIGTEVPTLVEVDEDRLGTWVADLAGKTDMRSRNASLTVDGVAVKILPSRQGRSVEQTEAVKLLSKALMEGDKRVEVPLRRTLPKVTEDSFKKTIVVCVSQRRLYLYDGDRLEKKYGVAVGTPGFPTPQGRFKIVQKRYLPTWSNPGSGWAKDMPRTIPPGPNNPLGTRALNIDSPGIRIHGTTADSSIGTAASHGCMRMHRWDIEDLYPRVEVGTPVFIVP